MLVLPPKARKYWTMLELESRLTARNEQLRHDAIVLKARHGSLSDPLFREALIRRILGKKKNSEEYLQTEGDPIR